MCQEAMEPRDENRKLGHSLVKDSGLKSKKIVFRTRFNLKTPRDYLSERRKDVRQFKKSGRRYSGAQKHLGLSYAVASCTRGLKNKKTQPADCSAAMAPHNTTQYIMDRVYEDLCEDWITQDNSSSQLPVTEHSFRLQDGTEVPFSSTSPQQSPFDRTLEFLQRDFENVVFWNEI